MDKKKTETLSFKIDSNFKHRIIERAEEEKRSTSNCVVKVLTEYLDEVDNAKRLLEKK